MKIKKRKMLLKTLLLLPIFMLSNAIIIATSCSNSQSHKNEKETSSNSSTLDSNNSIDNNKKPESNDPIKNDDPIINNAPEDVVKPNPDNSNSNNSSNDVQPPQDSNNDTQDDKDKLTSAYSLFNIALKSSTSIENVEAKQINTEENLLEYFNLENKQEEVQYSFKSATVDQTNNAQLIVVYQLTHKTLTIDKSITLSGFKKPKLSTKEKNMEMFYSLKKNIRLKSTKDWSLLDYTTLTVAEYLKLNTFDQNKYFEINELELDEIYKDNPLWPNSCYLFFNKKPNFKLDLSNPTSVTFEILIKVGNLDEYGNPINEDDPNDIIEKYDYVVNGFKPDSSYIGKLDSEPIKDLQTPANATSYKGRLETFKISDIKRTTHENYKDAQAKFSWDDYKKELVYHARFGLYQIFSDNFTEINYYTMNEIEGKQLDVVAEGIIKEDKANFSAYVQLVNEADHAKKYSVHAGDRIKVQFSYKGTKWLPESFDMGGPLSQLEVKNFDFAPSCDLINSNSSTILTNTFFSCLSSTNSIINIKVTKNGSSLMNLTPQIVAIWSFVIRERLV